MHDAASVKLTGISWDHTRGFLPKVATAQRFHEIHPHIEIVWQRRSLQEFADYSLAALARDFDLLVIDHPSIGEGARQGYLRSLTGLMPEAFLKDQADNSVGASNASYVYDGQQWGLAVDAATPTASWRPDVLRRHRLSVPQTWEELLDLARAGLVAVPAIPVDCLMNCYMLWIDEGEEPFLTPEGMGHSDTGIGALEALKELVDACGAENLRRNPIQTYEAMCERDDLAYCPFAYSYNNYARSGYARMPLEFGGLVTRRKQLRSTLGGAGLAISSRCRHPEIAAEYAAFMACDSSQRGIYMTSGGQPGHRAAWEDDEANRLTGDFFRKTRSTMEQAYLRPRHNGYIAFQEAAEKTLRAFLVGKSSATDCLKDVNDLYRQRVHA
jgi:multiple sugar transport system substrate-binding protein